jgi:hypothetical protein
MLADSPKCAAKGLQIFCVRPKNFILRKDIRAIHWD